jgi:hypothetical protein
MDEIKKVRSIIFNQLMDNVILPSNAYLLLKIEKLLSILV